MAKLPVPRVLKNVGEAIQTATPRLQASNVAQEKIIALFGELRENSGLTSEERADRQRYIDALRAAALRENEAVRRTMDELKTRHPRWIN
jgi:hypothetical protein